MHGTSMADTLNDNGAETNKRVQYFETVGQRGIWHDGWKAAARHERGKPFDTDVWELYNLDVDLAEIDDLAEEHPDKLKELIDLFWQEAEHYGVLPLDDLSRRQPASWLPEPKNRWVLYQDALLLGGIGVSGADQARDEACARAAVEALGLTVDA